MKKEQQHLIKKQVINLKIETNKPEDAPKIQQKVLDIYKKKIAPALEKILDKIAPEGVDIQLDKLVINLDKINLKNIDFELARQVRLKLERAIQTELTNKGIKIKKISPYGEVELSTPTKMDMMKSFLEDGFYPAWAATSNASVQTLMNELLEEKPKQILTLLRKYGRKSSTQKRLFYQFDNPTLQKFLSLLYTKDFAKVYKQIGFIRRRLQKQYPASSPKKIESLVLQAAFAHFLEAGKRGTQFKYSERAFNQTVIAKVQERYEDFMETARPSERSKIRAGFGTAYQNLDILEYFLQYGSMPVWADVSTQASLQDVLNGLLDTNLIGVQKLIEKLAKDPNSLQRLVFQFKDEQILKLLEPISSELLDFVKESIELFKIFAQTQPNISQKLSTSQARELVLVNMLEYTFLRKRSNFVKQTIFQEFVDTLGLVLDSDTQPIWELILEKTEPSESNTLELKELKGVLKNFAQRRKKIPKNIETAAQKLSQETQKISDRLAEIRQQFAQTTELAPETIAQLRKEQRILSRQLKKLEIQAITSEESQALVLQWTALEQELTKIEDANIRAQIIENQTNTEKNIARRLPILLKELEKQLAAAPSPERTLLLQKISRELRTLLGFWETRKGSLDALLETTQAEYASASDPQTRNLLRQRLDSLRSQHKNLETRIESVNTQFQTLKNTLAALAPATYRASESAEDKSPSGKRSKLDYLVFFLEFGASPWWADAYKKYTIEELFLELALEEPLSLRTAFNKLGKHPAVWQRLTQQLSEQVLVQVVERVYPQQADFILAQANILERIWQSQAFKKNIPNVPLKTFKWDRLMEILLQSPNLNEAGFVQQIIQNNSQDYGLSPQSFIEYIQNVTTAVLTPAYQKIQSVLPKVEEVPELASLELAYEQAETRRQLEALGFFLEESQKLDVIRQFLQTGAIPPLAAKARLEKTRQLEKLISEQIDKDAEPLRAIVQEISRSYKNLIRLVSIVSDDLYWDLVQLLAPNMVVLPQRYLQELGAAIPQKEQLLVAKMGLLEYARDNPNKLTDERGFVEYISNYVAAETNRKPLQILTEWRENLQKLSQKNTSLLVYVSTREIEEMRASLDKASLQTLLPALEKSLADTRQFLSPFFHRDEVEVKGLPAEIIPYEELFPMIENLKKEFFSLAETISKLDPLGDVLELVKLKTQQAQLAAKIRILSRKEPATLRIIRAQAQLIDDELRAQAQAVEKIRLQKTETVDNQLIEPENIEAFDPTRLQEIPRQSSLLARLGLLVSKKLPVTPEILESLGQETDWFLEKTQPKAAPLEALLVLLEKMEATPKTQQQILTVRQLLESLETARLEKKAAEQTQQTLNVDTALRRLKDYPQLVQIWEDLDVLLSFLKADAKRNPMPTVLSDWANVEKVKKELVALGDSTPTLAQHSAFKFLLEDLAETQTDIYQTIQLRAFEQLENETQQLENSLTQIGDLEELRTFEKQFLEKQAPALRQIFEKTETAQPFEQFVRNLRVKILQKNQTIREQFLFLETKKLKLLELEKQELAKQEKAMLEGKDLAAERQKQEEEAEAKRQQELAEVRKRRKKQLPTKPIDEQLQIKNAGLVILYPFLLRFFDALKLIEKRFFINDEAKYRAVHLLQYMATKQVTTPENELLLNKIMVGLPITAPVPFDVELTEAELNIADSLLQGVLSNWTQMKTMSIDALRSTFLIHNGGLKEEGDRWKLTVEKTSLDILLRSLPWAFTYVRFPWSEKAIMVEWDYMGT